METFTNKTIYYIDTNVVCIGGDPTTTIKSVILTKSTEAKKIGVKAGKPLSSMLRKCTNLLNFIVVC